MKLKMTLFLGFFAALFVAEAQESEQVGVNFVGKTPEKVVRTSFASRSNTLEAAVPRTTEPKDGRSAKVEVVPGKDKQTEDDYFFKNQHITTGTYQTRDLLNDFVVANTVGSPSDPAIAVGPDHVFIVYNTGFMIYDKDGNVLQGPTNPNAVFSNGGCCDLTISYDNEFDRWVMTLLYAVAAGSPKDGLEIAVSDGPDPTTANWNVYSLLNVSDYNKLSIHGGAYWVTDNGSNDVWAIDRNDAITGAATVDFQGFSIPGLQGQGFTSAQVLHVTNGDHPTTGGAPIVYMRDDAFAGVTMDSVNIWTVTPDFDVPGNSTVSAPEIFATTPFINVFDGGSFSNLTQPGGGTPIDALQSTIMNQAQFRKFPTYNSGIFNFVVDVDGGPGELAGIRWYEFRQDVDGGPWTMHQEGTYTAPDGKHAWNGSMSMDNQGNIALGYSTMAGPDTPNPNDNRVGAAYTGRLEGDALNTMTLEEDRFGISAGNIGGNRFGDYAKVSVDPSDDQCFWFITEYQNTNHVAAFKLAPAADNDTGVIAIVQPEDGALSATETIEVIVRNYGALEQSNVPVSFTIDGVTITETVAGPIAAGSNVNYTFTATADLSVDGMTYSINACTALVGDEVTDNDCTTKDVTHLNDNDTGVVSIDTPNTGNLLSATENVTITIQNFGALEQSNIPVFYSINGAVVNDTYPGPLASGATDTFTFGTSADLSMFAVYNFVSGTELASDSDTSNDDVTKDVENVEGYCLPTATADPINNPDFTGCATDGIKRFILNTISADNGEDGCNTEPATSPNGYADRTDLSTTLSNLADNNIYNLQAQTNWDGGVGVEALSVWIDFNDDLVFDDSERLISGEFFAVVDELDDFELIIPVGAPTGSHVLRAKAIDTSGGGDILNPCTNYQFGETQDYRVDIQPVLAIEDSNFAAADFTVTTLANNQFELNFNTTEFTDKLPVNIYNTLGQNLAFYTLENNGSGYNKTINMSYVSAGVYFIKVGNQDNTRVHRIVVK